MLWVFQVAHVEPFVLVTVAYLHLVHVSALLVMESPTALYALLVIQIQLVVAAISTFSVSAVLVLHALVDHRLRKAQPHAHAIMQMQPLIPH